jgi:hypothetical protein
MASTTDFRDCGKLASAVTAPGGAVPDVLGSLLSSYAVLRSPAPTQRPDDAILDACVEPGGLTAERYDELLPAAAAAAAVNSYRAGVARDAENFLLGAWHRALAAGAADQILDSLRKNFDRHAQAIEEARALFTAESSPEQVLASAEPKAIRAWQQLDEHIRVITRITAVAAQFGCRPGAPFPQVTEYALAENARIDDRAVMCCSGSVVADSWLFGRPDQGHRTSPFFRTTLRLHTIAEAQERYNEFAAIEFDKVHSAPRGGWIGEDGQMHEHPAPKNPYRTKVLT